MTKKRRTFTDDGMDTGDVFRAMRQARREHLNEVLPGRNAEIEALTDRGYTVTRLQGAYRINGVLDLYPVRRRWHLIPTNSRGWYDTAIAIVERKLKATS